MDNLQWAITTIVGILGVLVGRTWKKHDYRAKKDKETLKKIHKILPENSPSIDFFQNHDFGSPFERELLLPFFNLLRLLEQPNFFFLNKKIERSKISGSYVKLVQRYNSGYEFG